VARGPKRGLPKLGELERLVLEHLWSAGEADVLQTHAAVGEARGSSPNTVGSALERLHKKGLVTRTKVSHAYRYRAALDRDDFRARAVMEAAGGMRSLSREGLLSAFVNLLADDDQALQRLERLVAERRKNKGQDP
jgi:predicted transcriptional regulator